MATGNDKRLYADVREVVDDAAVLLYERGVENPNLGRLLRLTGEAENDFARQTGVLVGEQTDDVAAGTTDYTLAPSVTALTGTVTIASGSLSTITGSGSLFLSELNLGDHVVVTAGDTRTIATITSDTVATVTTAFTNVAAGAVMSKLSRRGVIKVKEVRYNGLALKPVDINQLDLLSSSYGDYYQTDFAFISNTKIRLGWTPIALAGGLKWIYHYEPNSIIARVTDALSVNRQHCRHLAKYVAWRILEQVSPGLGQLYQQDYQTGVRECAVWPVPEPPKPIRLK